MDFDTHTIFSSLMLGVDIFYRCRNLVLKRYLHETKHSNSTNIERIGKKGEKIVIYELKSLVSIVYTNLLL